MITSETVIDSLTPDQKLALANLAITSAKDLGYCEEASNVLAKMGFDLARQEHRVQIEFTVALDFGEKVDADSFELSSWQDGDPEFYEIQVNSVEQLSQ